MKVLPHKALFLEDIIKDHPGLSDAVGNFLLEACIITLHRSKHKSGIELQITGIEEKVNHLIWTKSYSSQIDRSWKDQTNATEHAAACISILLALKLTKLTIIEQSIRGTGFDYWLGSGTEDPDIFVKKARLEVSGIFEGDNNTIDNRVKIKIKQTNQSANTLLPAYISVIEFSKPKSKFLINK